MNKLFLSLTVTKTVIVSRSMIEFGCKIILASSACHGVRVKITGLNYHTYISTLNCSESPTKCTEHIKTTVSFHLLTQLGYSKTTKISPKYTSQNVCKEKGLRFRRWY